MVSITFDVAPNAPSGETALTFGSANGVSDAFGNTLNARYTDGRINISGPNAAGVDVSGRVLTPGGQGLRNAQVTITNAAGVTRTVTTTSFGYYRFEGIATGDTYLIGVSSNRYRFAPQAADRRQPC